MSGNKDKIAELTRQYPVVIELEVRWGDMDAFDHVNNIYYLRYFESARMAYFEALNVEGFFDNHGVGPILADTYCRYKFPLTYPDRVSVGARADNLEEDRFRHEYVIVSHAHGRVAAAGEGTIVTFDYAANRKSPIPEAVRRRIGELEASVRQGSGGL